MTHTKGPWITRLTGAAEHNNEQWLVLAADECGNEGDALICEVNTLDGADAKLITAAPELLKLAESNLATLDEQRRRCIRWGQSHHEIDTAIEETTLAIAKATS